MNHLRARTLVRFSLVVLFLPLLLVNACKPMSDEEILESILQNVNDIDGEITIVTKDGKTITLIASTEASEGTKDTIKETPKLSNYKEVNTKGEKQVYQSDNTTQAIAEGKIVGIEVNEISIKCEQGYVITIRVTDSTVIKLADDSPIEFNDLELGVKVKLQFDPITILPRLENVKDVFRALGVYDKAVLLREKGLSWAHIAKELGYDADKMHMCLQNIGEERIRATMKCGILTSDEIQELFNYFDRLALDWVKEIFADTEETPCDDVDLSTILPRLESIEDVFRTLGIWEDAALLHEEGLSWAHAAKELGYGADKMHLCLKNIGEERIWTVKKAGCLTPEEAAEMLNSFDHLVLEWIEEIFADI